MAYDDFKDLPRKTASIKVFRHNAFNINKTKKHDGYHRGLASVITMFLIKILLLFTQEQKLILKTSR